MIRKPRLIGRVFASPPARAGGAVQMEEGMPRATLDALEKMGHAIIPVSGYARATFGRGQIIVRDPESGVLCGGSDPRADGCAMGF